METITTAAVALALQLANDLRERGGADQIDALPKGTPGSRQKCVLALAFNFHCQVGGGYGNRDDWRVVFGMDTPEEVKPMVCEWAKDNDLEIVVDEPLALAGERRLLSIKLPVEIAKIAIAFDRYQLPGLVDLEEINRERAIFGRSLLTEVPEPKQ